MKVYKNFDIKNVLYYKIGGKVKYLLEVESKEDLLEAIDFIQREQIKKYLIIGGGANLLFPDHYFNGAVIKFVEPQKNSCKLIGENQIEAFSGETLDNVIQFAFENDLVGFEWAGGLPSTVGAAVRGNVGAFGGEIKDVFEKAELIKIEDSGHEVLELDKKMMDFSYRSSKVKKEKNLIITSVVFTFKKGTKEEVEKIKQIFSANIEYRKSHHPLEYPNCGSVFKNIEKREEVEKIISLWPDTKEKVEEKWHGKVSMGYIINRLALAGYKVGGAQISTKHNNFIVNLGDAKYDDVLSIINTVKEKFYEKFGFYPEVEIEIVNF